MMLEAFKDGVHPTPLHEMLMELIDLKERKHVDEKCLIEYHDSLYKMVGHLEDKGLASDGNGGVVMHKIAKIIAISGREYAQPALELLRRGFELVKGHVGDGESTEWIQMIIGQEIKALEATLSDGPSALCDAPASCAS